MKAKKIGKSLLLGILLTLAVCGADFLIIMRYSRLLQNRNLYLRQQTKRRFSNVQLPELFLRLGPGHRNPIPTSYWLLAEQ